MNDTQKIIFVYNAKSGFMHSMTDLFRKTTTPSNYPCKLCSLTYSGAFMKKMWKEYVASLGIETVFMHKDEFAKAYPGRNLIFPVILLASGDKLISLVDSDDFKKMNDLTDLINLMSRRLEREGK